MSEQPLFHDRIDLISVAPPLTLAAILAARSCPNAPVEYEHLDAKARGLADDYEAFERVSPAPTLSPDTVSPDTEKAIAKEALTEAEVARHFGVSHKTLIRRRQDAETAGRPWPKCVATSPWSERQHRRYRREQLPEFEAALDPHTQVEPPVKKERKVHATKTSKAKDTAAAEARAAVEALGKDSKK